MSFCTNCTTTHNTVTLSPIYSHILHYTLISSLYLIFPSFIFPSSLCILLSIIVSRETSIYTHTITTHIIPSVITCIPSVIPHHIIPQTIQSNNQNHIPLSFPYSITLISRHIIIIIISVNQSISIYYDIIPIVLI